MATCMAVMSKAFSSKSVWYFSCTVRETKSDACVNASLQHCLLCLHCQWPEQISFCRFTGTLRGKTLVKRNSGVNFKRMAVGLCPRRHMLDFTYFSPFVKHRNTWRTNCCCQEVTGKLELISRMTICPPDRSQNKVMCGWCALCYGCCLDRETSSWAGRLLAPRREAELCMSHTTFVSLTWRIAILLFAHYVWWAARKLPLTTARSSSEVCCSFMWRTKKKKKNIDETDQCKGLSNVTWHRLSFKQAFWEIGVSGVKMRVRSHAKPRKMKSSQSRIYFSSALNKHQKVFYKEQRAAHQDQNQW